MSCKVAPHKKNFFFTLLKLSENLKSDSCLECCHWYPNWLKISNILIVYCLRVLLIYYLFAHINWSNIGISHRWDLVFHGNYDFFVFDCDNMRHISDIAWKYNFFINPTGGIAFQKFLSCCKLHFYLKNTWNSGDVITRNTWSEMQEQINLVLFQHNIG